MLPVSLECPFLQKNTTIHRKTQQYTEKHNYTQKNTTIRRKTQLYTEKHNYAQKNTTGG
jgi:hypothetical protein